VCVCVCVCVAAAVCLRLPPLQPVPSSGPQLQVRDRKYGRTWIAVYAPAEGGEYE